MEFFGAPEGSAFSGKMEVNGSVSEQQSPLNI